MIPAAPYAFLKISAAVALGCAVPGELAVAERKHPAERCASLFKFRVQSGFVSVVVYGGRICQGARFIGSLSFVHYLPYL